MLKFRITKIIFFCKTIFLIFVLTRIIFEVDISAFIRELLFGHDCVIVPGFGGFIGNYSPATIDKVSGIFYPPVKQISFNRNLNHNDGLLVGTISASAKINYGDARLLVEEFVAGNRKRLEKGEKIVFDNIGSFINNQEGSIQFEPDRTANYHLDSFGLESFQCLPLEGYDLRKRILKHTQKDPVKQTSIRKIMWRAAVIVPLAAAIVAVSLNTDFFKSRAITTSLNPLVNAEFENNKKAVDESDKIQPVIGIANSVPVSVTRSEPAEPVSTTPDANSFYVITGSFRSEENAVSQVNILKEEGYSPEIVSAPNGFYRVCAMTCSDLNTAETKRDSISKRFKDAWVSRKK
jgi:nucleoid DNA-binding protein